MILHNPFLVWNHVESPWMPLGCRKIIFTRTPPPLATAATAATPRFRTAPGHRPWCLAMDVEKTGKNKIVETDFGKMCVS